MTRLLARVDDGDAGALAELVGVLHEELRLVARRHRVRWGGNETLCTTALVNEAYLKLARQEQLNLTDRAHFLALAGRAMRHILCNYAESRSRLKRGAGVSAVSLTNVQLAAPVTPSDDAEAIAELSSAMERLQEDNARLAHVVECRFFAGLTIEETAHALGLSPATVKRDWLLARAWLYRELSAGGSSHG